MAADILNALQERLEDELDGLAPTDQGLQAVVDARFGELNVLIEYDEEAGSIRVSCPLPPPAGAGLEFLLWCLHTNTQYWDVKFGLDDEGHLLVHADLDADEDSDMGDVAGNVADRAETLTELIDEDLVEWMLGHGFGTPAQRERWQTRPSTRDQEQE